MNTRFQFKGIPQTQALLSQVRKGVQKIERLTRGKGSLRISVDIFRKKYCVRIFFRGKGYNLEARSFDSYLYKAVNLAVGKIYSQLRKKVQMAKVYTLSSYHPSLEALQNGMPLFGSSGRESRESMVEDPLPQSGSSDFVGREHKEQEREQGREGTQESSDFLQATDQEENQAKLFSFPKSNKSKQSDVLVQKPEGFFFYDKEKDVQQESGYLKAQKKKGSRTKKAA